MKSIADLILYFRFQLIISIQNFSSYFLLGQIHDERLYQVPPHLREFSMRRGNQLISKVSVHLNFQKCSQPLKDSGSDTQCNSYVSFIVPTLSVRHDMQFPKLLKITNLFNISVKGNWPEFGLNSLLPSFKSKWAFPKS